MKGNSMKEFRTFSAGETVDLGRKLGKILNRGDLVCIAGDLGTGKTAITSGIAKALGIEGYITSPTFTIVNEYRADVPLFHFDVYRISDPDEMFEIGFEEYLESGGVVVIEWADLIKDILPPDYIWIDIKKDLKVGVDVRVVKMDFTGERNKDKERLIY